MIRVVAPAKINFFLEITGKRPDGYHTLSTIFQTISLADELTFTPADTLSMSCDVSALPADDSNLVLRAARALQNELGEGRGARIRLKKRIPMGAGLGGGSSDAAAALRGLLKLWNRRVGEPALRRLAVRLGADVPFFLKGGHCQATGIGEKLRPLKQLSRTWIVLVYPGFGVSTREAYAKVNLPFGGSPPPLRFSGPASVSVAGTHRVADPRQSLFNRFEELVFPDHPELPRLKQRLIEAGASAALMSGSGSSIFGLVPSESAGRRILAAIRPDYPQSWLVQTT